MPTYRPRHAAPRRASLAARSATPAPALPRHASRQGPRRVARGLGLALTAVLAFTLAGGSALTLGLLSGLDVSDVDTLLAGRDDRPVIPADPDDPFAGSALNILVMGTDYRGAGNAAIAGEGNEFHSDTTLLVHVAGDRSHVEVVSIPRDSLVEIPACPLPGGGQSRPRRAAMFNTAFAIGGGAGRDITGAAACTILTVEHNTGVRVTDHVVVMMNGVVGVVDAVGGVPMYLPEPVRGDHHVNLDLPAGDVRLDGDQAINFLRARGGRGLGLELGSDLARITRQQKFVDAMLSEILGQNLITSAPQLFRLTEAVLASVSPGRGLAAPAELAGLGWSLRGLDPAAIAFTELPVVAAPQDPNRVVWVRSEADAIWARIIAGEPPPELFAPEEPEYPPLEAAARQG
ncbi:cell envelope-related transcriptional attenuator [Xylanimonas cellulosilytica DSM 15894]|uniref:Cell envelope-related transcriptional attenuator n=1 Tax=Xylanimonas cellulosilytica (strain DSM 15894 / JCM 12276 / CECT 5975 / KCTC 9989 / LMG 20990 / NBRC 107835 / XIL07) TaxID=446471 RepID=D1BYY2_XYLCX|nr:LCP family protein [Xylanimonas cellulosilytica]ACZ30057.1 cell envelope-related transcriptional attenuator [Xylanimonas cellulosilytica DSM 15894]